MRTFFQPATFTHLATDHAGAVDQQIYASGASNVSEISVISHVDYDFDPSVIPAGFRNGPVVYRETPQQAFSEQYLQDYPSHLQQGTYQQVNYMPYQGPDVLAYGMGSMSLQDPAQQYAAARQYAQPQQYAQQQQQQQPPPPSKPQEAQIGISVWEEKRKFYVAGVTPGSSAEAMGLALGDHIRKLDRQPIKYWTLERVLARLRGSPKSRVIVRTTDKKVPVLRDCLCDDEEYVNQQYNQGSFARTRQQPQQQQQQYSDYPPPPPQQQQQQQQKYSDYPPQQ